MSDLEIYFALFLELIKRRFISYKLLDLHQFVLWLLYHIKQKFLLKSGIVPRLYSICMMNAWKSLAICCHSNLWFISNRDWIIEEEKESERSRERPEKTLSHNNKNCGSTVCESPLCGLISNFCIILVGIINTKLCLRRFIELGCISIEKHPNQYHYWSSFGVGTFKGEL